MPKGAKKSAEEIVKRYSFKTKRAGQEDSRTRPGENKKTQCFLAKERQEKRTEAGAALEKLYKESGSSIDPKKVLAICEKYWPDVKQPTQDKTK